MAKTKKTTGSKKSEKKAPDFALTHDVHERVAELLTEVVGLLGVEITGPGGAVETLDRDEVEAMKIKELRALAESLGLEETKKAEILAALEAGGHFGETEDEDSDEEDDEDADDESEDEDEDSDDEDEDGDEEGSGYDRDDLEDMDLKELRKIAKDEGHSKEEWKGLDQDGLIDLILGEDDEDSDDEDDDSDEDEEEQINEDDLQKMNEAQLKKLAKEIEVKLPKKLPENAKKRKAAIIKLLLESGSDEDDE